MNRTGIALVTILVILSGCSDPVETLKQRALAEYPKFWQQPEQIVQIRRTEKIPDDYKFHVLELTESQWDKKAYCGTFEWTFRFIKEPVHDFMEVRHTCYYDTDSTVLLIIKEERIHWVDMKISSRTFRFKGDEADRK